MRVLLARAEEDAGRSARFLARLGVSSIVAPVIETRDGVESPPEGTFDGMIVTSAKAASRLERLDAELRNLPVFAVGPRTARAIGSHGANEVHVSAGDAEALIRDIPRILPPPARLLHVAGRNRKSEPAQSLRKLGYEVSLWTAYVAEAVGELPEPARRALAEDAVDAALHYSPRSAKLLIELVEHVDGSGSQADIRASFAKLHHVVISPDVAAILRNAGFEHVDVAPEPNEKAMFRVLLNAWPEEGSRRRSAKQSP